MTLADFIISHSADDTARLILNRHKWPDIDIEAAVTAIECRRKLRTKLPEWFAVPEIVYPDRISAEQASSSITAAYKASVANGIAEKCCSSHSSLETSLKSQPQETALQTHRVPFRIADLTGGLGVDSLAFSMMAERVLYNEMDARKASAAKHNFPLLGADNIEVFNYAVRPSCAVSPSLSGRQVSSRESDSRFETDGKPRDVTSKFWSELHAFKPDIIYLDPARRSNEGNKVFLLEDCSPDVLTLLPDLFSITGNLLLKLSPMADISMLVSRLREHGADTKEVHVISVGGECKELLLWMVKSTPKASETYDIVICENGQILRFSSDTERNSSVALFEDEMEFSTSKQLFEPGKALFKSGLFNTICTVFAMRAAGLSTHIYFSANTNDTPEGTRPDTCGKLYEILETTALNKQSIRDFSKKYPKAEVTARNIPMRSEDLRDKLKCKSGSDIHIFGLRLDFKNSKSGNYLVAARKIKN